VGNDEAQVVEQAKEPEAGVFDVTGMTDDQIGERIDNDAAFAKAFMEDRITRKEPAPAAGSEAEIEAGVDPNTGDPGDGQPAAEETPASPEEPAPEPRTEVPGGEADKVFTIKKGELPEGFDTPGKVFKSVLEKEKYIQSQKEIIQTREGRIRELEEQIRGGKPSGQSAAERPAQPSAEDEEIDDAKLYDPVWMKEQLKEIKRLRKDLAEAKASVNEVIQDNQAQKTVNKTILSLKEFQKQHQVLNTTRPLDVIDQEYKEFVEKIAVLTGTTQDQREALTQVNVFLNDKGEAGNSLRKAAEENGVALPEEFDSYLKILNIRDTARRGTFTDPQTGEQRPFTLEEAYRMTYPDLYANPQASVGQKPTATPPKPGARRPTQAELEKLAERQRSGSATDIPPSMSGKSVTVDDLTEAEIDVLMAMTPAQMRANPNKVKLLNEVYKRMDIPPVNPYGTQV